MRIVIFYSGYEVRSVSSARIEKALLRQYRRRNFKIQKIIKYGLQITDSKIEKQIAQLDLDKIDAYVFTSFQRHPQKALELLRNRIRRRGADTAEYVFHIYGNFFENLLLWRQIEKILLGKKIRFMMLSREQASHVKCFVNNDRICQVHVPEVSGELFYYSKSSGLQMRRKLGIQKQETVFLYAGRISHQKNISSLIKTFLDFRKSHEARARLIIAGEFDDLGDPLFGYYPVYGMLEAQLAVYMQNLPEQLANSVIFMPNQKPMTLNRLYNACDCFVSVGTHHDEDFGLAPIEALYTGAKLIITRWAGFKQIIRLSESSVVVEMTVNKKPEQRKINSQSLLSAYAKIYNKKTNSSARYTESLKFKKNMRHLSRQGGFVNTTSRFSGFSEIAEALSKRLEHKPWAPFLERSESSGSGHNRYLRKLYGKVYESYWSK